MPRAAVSWSRAASQGGGEAGPVGVGAGPGLDRGDHGHAQQLVEGEQRPELLLEAGPVTRAQHLAVQQGVPQRQVGGLDLPPLVVEPRPARRPGSGGGRAGW